MSCLKYIKVQCKSKYYFNIMKVNMAVVQGSRSKIIKRPSVFATDTD